MNDESNYILIVENSIADAHLLQETMKLHDFVVDMEVLYTGKAVMEKMILADSPAPTLIILALKLQDIDGMELLKAFQKNPVYERIPVIVRTGSLDPRHKKKCEEIGIFDFMSKTMDFESLEKQVLRIKKHWDELTNFSA